jgi:hypothetical protein
MSATRRRARRLRIDTFEDRVVPTIGVGVSVDSYGVTGGAPNGNSLAVGPNHVVQVLAGDVEVLDKTGNFLLSETDAAFWTAAGISSSLFSVGLSEPRVAYDALANRWFATEISLALHDNEIFVARSDTSDPTGHWSAVHYTGAAGMLTQYTTLGVDANGVYVGAADLHPGDPIFNLPPTAAGSSLTAIPKADMLAATPTAANRTTFEQLDPNVTMGWAPQVVTNFDPNPTHASVVATDYTVFHTIDVTPITWSGGVPTLGTTVQVATSLNSSLPGLSRQPNGSRIIDGGADDRYMGAVYQVGDLIYAAHTLSVNSSGTSVTSGTGTHNAIHVVVVRASTNALVAEKIYFNSTFDYSFASIAANANGDIVMGLNRSGSGTSGQLGGYVVHGHLDLTNSNVLQRITFDQELAVAPGQANGYNVGDNPEPWGPYSATVVDPTNPNVFWTTQEYATANDTWLSRVVSVGTVPKAVSVSTTAANGTYGVGAVISITVSFDAAVTVTGTPKLHLNSGGDAVYTGGSGTSTLTFTYTVAAGQTTTGGKLDYTSTTPFDLTGATIVGDGGVAANLTLPTPGSAGSLSASSNIVIDTTAAQVTGVSSPLANGTYGAGTVVPITVTFSHSVSVTGTPKLALNSGGTAFYSSGSGTTTLTFNYTVAAGDSSPDLDYTSTNALTLNGGTITDQVVGGPANLTLPAPGTAGSLGANKNIVIDAVAASVTNVTSPTADGTYGIGAVINVTVQFSKAVTVTGTPQLALNSGGTASYASGSGTNTLTFTYTVAAGNSAGDLDEASTTSLALNGGSIQAAGLGANLTLPAPGATGSLGANKNIVINTSAATVANVTSPTADGTYGIGAVINVTVQFTQVVTVTGTPQLALNSGGTASYASGSGTNTLTFTYTVAAGNASADLDEASTTALTLNGGSIQAGGQAAILTLPTPGTSGSLGANKNIVINTSAATVTNVTSPTPDGTYNVGAVINVTVQFSQVATVTGTPQLALNSSGTASYLSGSGTNTLTFQYTVAAGNSAADLDEASTTALTLNGGSIQAGGQAAVLTLPAPGATGSLGANKNIVVDAVGPSIVDYRVLYGTRSYSLFGSTRFDLPWQITGVQVVFSEPVMTGNIHSLTGLTALRLTGLKTTTLTWKFRGISLGRFNTTLANSGANALKDQAGNPIPAFAQAFNVLWGDVNGDGSVNALDEAAVRAAEAGPFQPGSAGYNIFADLSGDGIVNLIDVGIARSRKGTHL